MKDIPAQMDSSITLQSKLNFRRGIPVHSFFLRAMQAPPVVDVVAAVACRIEISSRRSTVATDRGPVVG